MTLHHCPECISRDYVFVLVWPDETACRRCGTVPEIQLTPREIRMCLKASDGR